MCGLKCAESREIIPSFDLSAAFLLKQPRMCWISCCLACGWLVSTCCLPFFQLVQDGIASLPSNLLTVPLNLMPSTNGMRSLLSDKDIKQDGWQYINLCLAPVTTTTYQENFKIYWKFTLGSKSIARFCLLHRKRFWYMFGSYKVWENDRPIFSLHKLISKPVADSLLNICIVPHQGTN